ncbi:MAG: hypothetical protein JRI59_04415, partial [Deltaproteobacteria bacterium]|nr:hypothetical protein [Deltaproteobacteria bacterium]
MELVGAGNEYLLLHCRFPGADPASFKIKVIQLGRRGPVPRFQTAFYQLCWAPPASRGKLPPDALLPLDQGLVSTGQALDIIAVFHILSDSSRGTFRLVLVATDKRHIFRLPLKLRVYRFDLPDDLPISIFAQFWPYSRERYRKYGVSATAYLPTIQAYYQSLRKYKVNVLGGVHFFPFDQLRPDTRIEEFRDYHELVEFALNRAKFRSIMIPKLWGWKSINSPGGTFLARALIFYPLYQAYLKRHGWQDRALNYLIDEPKPQDYPAVQQAFALVKKLAPTVRTLCTGWNPAPEF